MRYMQYNEKGTKVHVYIFFSKIKKTEEEFGAGMTDYIDRGKETIFSELPRVVVGDRKGKRSRGQPKGP